MAAATLNRANHQSSTPRRPLADEHTRKRIANELRRVKIDVGVPMRVISEVTGFTPGIVGRAERGRVYATEVGAYETLFKRVEKGDVKSKARRSYAKRRADAVEALKTIEPLLERYRDEPKKTERVRIVNEALELIHRAAP